MKWIFSLAFIFLTACASVIEPRDVVVSQQVNRLEFGNNCSSIDVTDTKISTY